MWKNIKKYLPMFLLIIFTFTFVMKVNAQTMYLLDDDATLTNCYGILGDIRDKTSAAYFLQEIYNIVKYLTPLICIVLTIMEFIKAITSQDKDALMKATKRTGIRIVLCLVLFVIPVLINFLFPLFGWNGTCGIG